MPGLYVNTDVFRYGPIFDGRAEFSVEEFQADVTRTAAEVGRDMLRVAALGMDKSGRGGTGAAARGVLLFPIGIAAWRIYGAQIKGKVWWPWLEGDSKRNLSTKFKGYHAFRATRWKLTRAIPAIAEMKLAEYLPEMGGEVL
jgi:hypothetical protein